jgi:hypothetical protein
VGLVPQAHDRPDIPSPGQAFLLENTNQSDTWYEDTTYEAYSLRGWFPTILYCS